MRTWLQQLRWSWWLLLFAACGVVFLAGGNIPALLAILVLSVQRVVFDTFLKPLPVVPESLEKALALIVLFGPPVVIFILAYFVVDVPRTVLAIAMPSGLLLLTTFLIWRRRQEQQVEGESSP